MKLRIWHIPQVPGEPIYIPVDTEQEASRLLAILAIYDQFQYMHSIKGDFSNAQGVQYWDEEEGQWFDYYPTDKDGFEMDWREYEDENFDAYNYVTLLMNINNVTFNINIEEEE